MTAKTQVPAAISHIQATLAIAVSYFHEGKYEEARALLVPALTSGEASDKKDVFSLRLCLAMVEQWDGNIDEALRVYQEIAPEAGMLGDDLLAAKFYGNFAFALRRADEGDRAILMLTSASWHFEQIGEWEQYFSVENNIGNILADAKQFEGAHVHFDKARKVVKERHNLAQVNESQAAAYLAEAKTTKESTKKRELLFKALHLANASIALLEGSERLALIEESVKTLGRICDALEKQFKLDAEKPQIEAALLVAKSITAAARLLGMSDTTLNWKLENQHQELLYLRPEKKKARGIHVARSKQARPAS